MERELSELFQGRRVDLVPPKFLNPRIRDLRRTFSEESTLESARLPSRLLPHGNNELLNREPDELGA
jgi:hypothetical protein